MTAAGTITLGRLHSAKGLDRKTRTAIAVARAMLRRAGRYEVAERALADDESDARADRARERD